MKVLSIAMLAVLALAKADRDLSGGGDCAVTVIMTNLDEPDDKVVTADGMTCMKVEDNGLLSFRDVSRRRLTGGSGGGDCQGPRLFESDCTCDNRRVRRRLSGGGGCDPNGYEARLQSDGQFKVEPVGGGDRLWKSNRRCSDRRQLSGAGSSCADNELYAVVRNGCDNDYIQVWEWELDDNDDIVFTNKIWSQEMDSDRCYP